MRVLITGVRGVIGRHLLPLLLQDDSIAKVVGISRKATHEYRESDEKYAEAYCQLDSPLYVIKLMSTFKPDIIFNLAATSTANSPAETVWKNTNITLNLLEQAKDRPTKFIQASSITVDNQPQSPYSVSKLASEALLESYKQLYSNITGFSFRTCAVVGSGNQHGLVKDIIRKVLAEGNTVELFGKEPGSIKPYIYAKELADVLYSMYDEEFYNYGVNYPWTICPEDSISVKQVAELVMKQTGVNKKIIWNPLKTWITDQPLVTPSLSHNTYYGLTSSDAIIKATQDILREDY